MELAESMIRLSVPLLFAALAGVLSERAGVVNIALEGMLLWGAFAAMAATAAADSGWIGIGAAALAGAVVGLLHAVAVLGLRIDAILSGMGLNLLALGGTTYLLRAAYSRGGVGIEVDGPAGWLPALKSVPVLGTLLGASSPFPPLALAATAGVWLLLERTRPGLQLRALGESPEAARAAGVPVEGGRTLALVLGGALAGVGGAYLSLEAAGRFTENASAGRGYLALAAVLLGGWRPAGAALAVLLFAFGEAAQIALQGRSLFGARLPSELASALPYLLGLVTLAGAFDRRGAVGWDAAPPAALGRDDES